MKKFNSIGFLKAPLLIVSCWLVTTLTSSCNKDFDKLIPNSYQNDSTQISAGQKKVLYIILDGVRGAVLASMKPTNIVKINKNATYSFVGLNDSTRVTPTNAGSWTSMLTGVNPLVSKVTSDDFANNQLATFPSIFTRLKQVNPNLKTVSLASSTNFDSYLATDATEHEVFATDADTKNSAVTKIGSTDADLVVAQFHSADVAGTNGGYNLTNTNYTTTITTLDGYLGEILNALKARPSYADESWLVIIASNKGGEDATASTDDSSLFGDPTKNTYVAFYNPAFDAKPFNKPNTTEIPYAGSAPRISAAATTTTTAQAVNTTLGNVGANGTMTVFCKVRIDKIASNYGYPEFLSKRETFSASVDGWCFFLEGNYFQVNVNGASSGSNIQAKGGIISDGAWHNLAFKIWYSGAARMLTVFTDGVKNTSVDITAAGNLDNTSPIRLGSPATATAAAQTNNLITEIAVYNKDFTDTEILTNMKRVNLNTLFTAYSNNLLSYYPALDGSGLQIKDRSGNNNDMVTGSNLSWAPFLELTPNVNPDVAGVAYRTVPNDVDLPFQIYNWLGVITQTNWGLTGRTWSPSYTSLSTN